MKKVFLVEDSPPVLQRIRELIGGRAQRAGGRRRDHRHRRDQRHPRSAPGHRAGRPQPRRRQRLRRAARAARPPARGRLLHAVQLRRRTPTGSSPSGSARSATSTRARTSSACATWSPNAPPTSRTEGSRRHGSRHRTQARPAARMPTPAKFEVTCSSCNLRELCLPGTLCAEDLARVENVVYARRRAEARRHAVHGRRRVQRHLRHPQRLLQDQPGRRRGPRAGHRLLHGRRADGPGGPRRRRLPGHRDRARGQRSLRPALRAGRGDGARSAGPAAPAARGPVARDRARPRRHDAARLDARRGAPRHLPPQPVQALRAPRLLGFRLPPAHDARGARQLPRPQARDRQPPVLPLPGGRPDRSEQKHVRIVDTAGLERILGRQG